MRENKKNPTKLNEKSKRINKRITLGLAVSLLIGALGFIFNRNLNYSIIAFLASFLLFGLYFLIKEVLRESERIKRMEEVFPDFVELMASNLRAGMTIDRALLLSSRKEFSPLDEELINLGKDILTGNDLSHALLNMGRRTKSEKILKTILIINSGIRSGGNLAILLEQTAINMRERGFVEKRAASNVLMYVIFIFFAVAVGAPMLFSLSTVLVQVLTAILEDLPSVEESITTVTLPLALSSLNISVNFILYFAIVFLVIVDVLAALLLGLVSKGEEKSGLRYVIPILTISMVVFFVVRIALLSYFSDIIS